MNTLTKHKAERITRFESPYEDQEAKTHQFHAVFRSNHDDICFLSAPTSEGLKVGLSSLDSVKKVIAVYVGKLVDFHESRDIVLKQD
jgi:hypothetical protein